jgi:hypothetical protein
VNGGREVAIVEASIVVNRPVEEVAGYLHDPASSVEWQAGLADKERTSAGPTAVGTTYRGTSSFLGRRLEWTSEVVEFEPHKRFMQKVTVGPLRLEETYILEPIEGGTRFTFIGEGEPRWFFRLAYPLVRVLQRNLEGDLARLKEILEAQGQGN